MELLDIFNDMYKSDILTITEHWQSEIQLDNLILQGYQLVSRFCRTTSLHGGSVIFVRKEIMSHKFDEVKYIKNKSIERCMECSAVCRNGDVCVITVYRPPDGDIQIFFESLEEVIAYAVGNFKFIFLTGDLNVDRLVPSMNNKILDDLFCSYGLKSLVDRPTRVITTVRGTSSTSIDYMVTNLPGGCRLSVLDAGVSDHLAQYLTCIIPEGSSDMEQGYRWQRRINDRTICEFQYHFRRETVHFDSRMTVDEAFCVFWNHFSWCFQVSHPTRKIKDSKGISSKYKFKPTPQAIDLSKQLKELNWIKKITVDPGLHINYKNLKKKLTTRIETEKREFYANIIHFAGNKNKQLWELINEKMNKRKAMHTCIQLRVDDSILTEKKLICDVFGHYFANEAKHQVSQKFPNKTDKCTVSTRSTNTMFFHPITNFEVEDIIHGMNNKKSVGLDEVPIRLLKACCSDVSPYLSEIINISVTQGIFPTFLKKSKTVPVFKKGNKEDVQNYRPITVVSPISKVIEKAMYLRLISFLDDNKILTSCQHGFRRGLSTETAIAEMVQYIYDRIDKGYSVVGLFFDLSKAFDTLDPTYLKEKLEALGIRGPINEWLVSYVKHRQLIVKMEDAQSEVYDVELGTPQGGTLGSQLFLLYVNDLPEHITVGRVFLYADDTTILVESRDGGELTGLMTRAVREFSGWCEKNRLIINLSKTVCVEFTGPSRVRLLRDSLGFDDIELPLSDDCRFLGIQIDGGLDWGLQVDGVCARLHKSFFAISSLKKILNADDLVSVYYATFHSILSYGIVGWGQAVQINRVFILQKRVIRRIFGLARMDSCRPSFRAAGILTVASIYLLKVLIRTHAESMRGQLKKGRDVHSHDTRNKNNIVTERFYHSYHKRSPGHFGSRIYNMLSTDLRKLPLETFKKKLKLCLLEHCFYTVREFEEFLRGESNSCL